MKCGIILMQNVHVPTEPLVINKTRYNNNRNEYRLDLWREVEKRWMVFGILISVMMAVLTSKLGAPGGKLHTDVLRYLPLACIYYSAGQRAHCWDVPRRVIALTVAHAHLVAPMMCVVTVAAFRDGVDHRVVKGALLSSLGGGCPWLSVALCQCDISAVCLFVNSAASVVAVPLYSLILCGTMTPSINIVIAPTITSFLFYFGNLNKQHIIDRNIIKIFALFLLYVECCERLVESEGSLHVGHVLGTLLLECSWLTSSIAMCIFYYQCGVLSAREAHVVAAFSVPKGLEFSTTCPMAGLYSLPGVFLAPAQALFLSSYQCPDEKDNSETEDKPSR